MKKLILLAVVACSFVAANAKTVKKTFKVEGKCENIKCNNSLFLIFVIYLEPFK